LELARCERAQGHLDQAIHYYQSFLAAVPDAGPAAAARAELRQLQPPDVIPVPGWGEAAAAPEPEPETFPDASEFSLLPPESPPPDVPAAAVSDAPKGAPRSHWIGIGLAAASVVSAGFAIVGAVRALQYAQTSGPATSWAQYSERLALHDNAQNWATAAIILGPTAAAGAAGAVLAW
jgi:hypothetical protein